MKRNTYIIATEGSTQTSLIACLGIRKSKKFDYGLGYKQKDNTIRWKGVYSKTPEGWERLVQRCHELHELEIFCVMCYGGERK